MPNPILPSSQYIDFVVCANCGTEAFSWMAEVFACPACGGWEYVEPHELVKLEERVDRELQSPSEAVEGKKKRKRERSPGDC